MRPPRAPPVAPHALSSRAPQSLDLGLVLRALNSYRVRRVLSCSTSGREAAGGGLRAAQRSGAEGAGPTRQTRLTRAAQPRFAKQTRKELPAGETGFGVEERVSDEGFFDEQEEQSAVKATIVAKPFCAWARVLLPSIKKRGGKIGYIDLFAGPGRYKIA